MKVIRVKTEAEMSAKAAELIAGQIQKKKESILGLATGSTPIGTYKELIRMNEEKQVDFSGVKAFNLDEYVGLGVEDDQSYAYFMRDQLFSHVNIKEEQTHIPNGLSEDTEAECEAYDQMIRDAGGVDLQLLGIGLNGHIGFNEPADELVYGTHKEKLTDSTVEANARFFADKNDVPTHALSMGIGTIMEAASVLLLGGPGKQNIIEAMLRGGITTKIPASLLKLHKDVTVIYVAD